MKEKGDAKKLKMVYLDKIKSVLKLCEHSVENEMDEIRWVQSQYIKMLSAETDLSQAQLKKMLQRKVNIYLSAEEAVEMGIADTIV